MMKVLLYYPKLNSDEDSKPLYTGLPLSVMAIAAQFDRDEYLVRIIDGRLEDWKNLKLEDWIDDKVVCVGISSMTSYQIKDGLRFAAYIREINPAISIVWGGWHPSLMPSQTIENDLVDMVIIGQGEETFPNLVKCIEEKRDFREIENLVYKENGEVQFNMLKPLRDLTSIKGIENAYPYVNMSAYIQPLWGNKRILGYESSRGCPWRCKFCSIGSVYSGRWNALPAETVADDVEYLYRNYNIDAIHFFDNNFFVDAKRVLKYSELIRKKEIPVKWDGTVVVEQFLKFDDDYIEKLKESGLFRVIVGAESGDEDVLKKINKMHTNAQLVEMVEKCNKHGLMASLSFMVGFPWNPEKDLSETIELIELIKRISSQAEILLFIFSPYLGTELYNTAKEFGMIFPDNLEAWSGYTYERANVPWISEKMLRKINRYISFFGTKNMSSEALKFLQGGKTVGNMG